MKYVISIQYLRALASILVVFYHTVGLAPFQPFPQIGAFGVDIFFVISGFIMWITSRQMSATTFAAHRLIRIVPIYWLTTAAVFLAGREAAVTELLKSLFFVPYYSAKTDSINPIVAVGWTLNFEMLFYGIFTLGLLSRHRAIMVPGVIIALVAIGQIVDFHDAILFCYTSPLLLEFLAGCCLGFLYEKGKAASGTVFFSALLPIGFVICILNNPTAENFTSTRALEWGFPAFLMVAGALALEKKLFTSQLLALLGESSYSLYLVHSIVLVALAFAFRKVGWQSGTPYVLIGLFCSVMAGIAVHLVIEKPVTSFLRQLAQRVRLAMAFGS